MIKNYASNGGFDEMIDAKGTFRPHYRKFQKLLTGIKPPDFDAGGHEFFAAGRDL
ncbi:MAG: hypothetical protein WDM76_14005 [Limisphaerales bacterium]